MIAYITPLAATLGPVAAMVVGGWYATKSVRPENRS